MRSSRGPDSRPRYSFHLGLGAAAPAGGMAVPAALAGIHGGDQHEPAGKDLGAGDTGDLDPALLHGLPQDLQGLLVKLGQLIQKKDPVVGQGDLPLAGAVSPPPARPIMEMVWWGARKGRWVRRGSALVVSPRTEWTWVASRASRSVRVGEDGGQPSGQHGFTRSRWADHSDVVAAGGGDLQSPLHRLLAPSHQKNQALGSRWGPAPRPPPA